MLIKMGRDRNRLLNVQFIPFYCYTVFYKEVVLIFTAIFVSQFNVEY
jgi:hypothetical protein